MKAALQSNKTTTMTGPSRLVRDNNTVATNYLANQYMGDSVNLIKFGFDPASFSENACGTRFRRVLIKTCASASFTIEYSTDNRVFKPVANVLADPAGGAHSYRISHQPVDDGSSTVFYRIRLTGTDQSVRYSKTISIRVTNQPTTTVLVYPNPVTQSAWISIDSQQAATASITVYDSYGRAVLRQASSITSGHSVIQLKAVSHLQPGIYHVSTRVGNHVTTQKILVVY